MVENKKSKENQLKLFVHGISERCPNCGFNLVRSRGLAYDTGNHSRAMCSNCDWRGDVKSDFANTSENDNQAKNKTRYTSAYAYLQNYSKALSEDDYLKMNHEYELNNRLNNALNQISLDFPIHLILYQSNKSKNKLIISNLINEVLKRTKFNNRVIYLDMILINQMLSDTEQKDEQIKLSELSKEITNADLLVVNNLGVLGKSNSRETKFLNFIFDSRKDFPVIVNTYAENKIDLLKDFNSEIKDKILNTPNEYREYSQDSNNYILDIN